MFHIPVLLQDLLPPEATTEASGRKTMFWEYGTVDGWGGRLFNTSLGYLTGFLVFCSLMLPQCSHGKFQKKESGGRTENSKPTTIAEAPTVSADEPPRAGDAKGAEPVRDRAPDVPLKPTRPVPEVSSTVSVRPTELSEPFRNPDLGWVSYDFAASTAPGAAKVSPFVSSVYSNFFSWGDLEPAEGIYEW